MATGFLALDKPTAVYGFTGLTANGVRGVSEIHAIFGGLLIALGLAPLFLFSARQPAKCLAAVIWGLPQRGHSRLYSTNPPRNPTS